ncbi:MAG: ATP synthase F0 subunit C [Bryobacteraceae bacterium]|nr:ATP synthase F0 subunit C [Bryobacteraceae bacterium]
MKLKSVMLLAMLLLIAAPMFAQEAAGAQPSGTGLLVPAFAMAIASGLCALGQGKAIAAAAEGVARNPGAAGAIRILLLLGLAFIESLALFTFVKVG